MSIFNVFKKKGSEIHTDQNAYRPNTPPTPTQVFNALGPNMYNMWEALVVGQNRAVKIFDEFKKFKEHLDGIFSSINYDRNIINININNNTYQLKTKHCMYLYMLKLDKDTFISLPHLSGTSILSYEDYLKIKDRLLPKEINYCKQLITYLENHILPIAQEADLERYGIVICKEPVLFNSLALDSYHRSIAYANHSNMTTEHEKHPLILDAPFLHKTKNTEDNPLVITEITSVSAFVLDYLCHGTMSTPILNLIKLLSYSNEKGESVKKAIIKNFGINTYDYILNILYDMSGNTFRQSVFNGMLIK